jgi:hypothetical protein
MDLENLNNYKKIVELYHLMNDDEALLKVFYANDYPVPFKELILYPVEVDLYLYFHLLVECLVLPHKVSGDLKAISMSYFKYLCYLATEKGETHHLVQLGELLLIILKKPKEYIKDGVEKCTIEINLQKCILKIEDKSFNEKDFDKLRKIILEQNAIELPDETIHPDVLKAYKEMEEYKIKQSKVKMCSFEDQINVVVAKSSYRRDEVVKMTIRSFSRLLERVDKIMHYEIMTLLSLEMDKKDRQSIEHYMAGDKTFEEKYKDAMMGLEEMKNKIK